MKGWVARTTCGLIGALCVVAAGSGVSAASRGADGVTPPATCLEQRVAEAQLNALTALLDEQNEALKMLLAIAKASDQPADALFLAMSEKLGESAATQRMATAVFHWYIEVASRAVLVGCHPGRVLRVS